MQWQAMQRWGQVIGKILLNQYNYLIDVMDNMFKVEVYLNTCQRPLTIFTRSFIIDVKHGPKCASGLK